MKVTSVYNILKLQIYIYFTKCLDISAVQKNVSFGTYLFQGMAPFVGPELDSK